MNYRYLAPWIVEDLASKMVFLAGPRQVGKTTLAREIIGAKFSNPSYFNWDHREDRKKILGGLWPTESGLVILDEIHKFNKWKNLVKGFFDHEKKNRSFLVTGSARLNLYRRGGDSLQGRYHHYRLHPFSLGELKKAKAEIVPFKELPIPSKAAPSDFEILLRFGGFPEPMLSQSERTLRRWHKEKSERLFREDIRDVEAIRDFGNMVLLGELLPSKVGSLLSTNSLREDLEVSFRAVSHWLTILETFYYHFRIYPFAANNIRSLKKEPKLYLWDWSEIPKHDIRFENMVASHLLKMSHFLEDTQGYKTELHFLRDKEKREVDFLFAIDKKPWFACEVKWDDETVSRSLLYFKEKLKIPYCFQVVKKEGVDHTSNGIRVISASKFLSIF